MPVIPAIGCERHWLDRDDAVALETFCEVFWVAGDVSRNNKGAATLSFMAVNLYAWSSEVSRVRILALSLVAAITLSSGALGGGGGAGGAAGGAGGAAGASGARGTAGDKRYARNHGKLKQPKQRSECSAPWQHRPKRCQFPGDRSWAGAQSGPFQ